MKSYTMKWIPFFVLFFLVNKCFSNQIEYLANTNAIERVEFKLNELTLNQLAIAMPFAKELILNPEQKKALTEKAIIKVELVYTKHRTSPLFDQKKLNIDRLKELQKLLPVVFENPLWDFELISQTKGRSREDCKKMFHGFVFTFRPNSTKETLQLEAEYIQRLVLQSIKNDSLKNSSNKLELIADIKTRWDNRVGYVHDTIWKEEEEVPVPHFFYDQSLYQDSTVLNSFSRNKKWNNFIVVTDVTGSMSPYIAQVFMWLREQTKETSAQGFVFFNDGDNKPSNRKKPLETEGVYVVNNNSTEEVMLMAAKCMKKGSGGGENLENDIEAILLGQNQYKEIDEVVLVADNRESMRDYKFIEKIKKPVRIILCGSDKRVNIQYLDLARQTKGSVHTKVNDILNLDSIENGAHFFIGEFEYLFENNQFHYLYN
ncbi:hypothetical protein FRY74_10050 [Vicingus serpentipes]|uniref:VWA domain-containing protein n=1 Tax=Vicingus serpentipes TaxID=1926625 RepID=A0A5C6RRA2_9FLAO|nr:hypothetical protein [Vicingus serpentipes]TXB64783.1 hypothetical protein FRY74_10050 [Vicingus serpentipes]